jgi:hypothetical protein
MILRLLASHPPCSCWQCLYYEFLVVTGKLRHRCAIVTKEMIMRMEPPPTGWLVEVNGRCLSNVEVDAQQPDRGPTYRQIPQPPDKKRQKKSREVLDLEASQFTN